MGLGEERLKSTLMEGFGDDLVYATITLLFTIIGILATFYYWKSQQPAQQAIHPDSQENVETVLAQRPHPTPSAPPLQEREPSMAAVTCPICLGEAEYAVETNCAHTFCTRCVITYWRTGNWLGPIRCPVCRQTVTVLLRYFSPEERRAETPERTEAERDLNQYNRRFSGEPLSWLEYLRDSPTMVRHLFRDFFSVGGLYWMFRMRIFVLFVMALLYFISPLDIIPEALFGILGLLDDLFVLMLLAIYVSIIYRRTIAQRGMAAAAAE